MPGLIVPPAPPLTGNVTDNPYDDPDNPPSDPEAGTDVCGVRWAADPDPGAGGAGPRRYELRNFSSEAAAAARGFSVTHTGHCGACSSLQVGQKCPLVSYIV